MGASLTFTPVLTNTGTTNAIIGGGGFVTGGDIADDGTIIVRCDTTGPLLRRPGDEEWTRLYVPGVTVSASLLSGSEYPTTDPGTYDVAICATDPTKGYFTLSDGYTYKWADTAGTVTVTRTALGQKTAPGNEDARTTGKPLAVDPVNANVVFDALPDGLHYSLNSGTDWTSVPTNVIPAPTAGKRMIVAFDRSSPVVSGKTQGIYNFVNGAGLYHSTDGGATWSAVSGAPTIASRMVIGETDGYVHLIGDGAGGDGQYRRWDKSTWIAPSGITGHSVCLSPLNAGRMWLTCAGGKLNASADNGATWPNYSSGSDFDPVRVATDIDWMAWTTETFMSDGDILFDRAANRLWFCQGIGTWTKDSPAGTITGPTTWTERSKGIENMVVSLLTVTPNGLILAACHDRTGFAIPRTYAGVVYPATHAKYSTGGVIVHGGNIDYAPEDPTFLVLNSYNGNYGSPDVRSDGLFSEDSGVTWQPMPGSITDASGNNGGGNIIALSKTVFVQIETYNGKLMFTDDAGATWDELALTGSPPLSDAHFAYFLHRRILVKDEHVTNQAYFYNVTDGIWRLNYSGGTFTTTKVKSGQITGQGEDKYHTKLRQIGADDWLWCGGDNFTGLYRSTDGMVEWNPVTGTDNILGAAEFGEVFGVDIGYGGVIGVVGHRQVTPSGSPADYSGYGLWVSTDGMATWVRKAQFPNGYYSRPADLAADKLAQLPGNLATFYLAPNGEGLSKIMVAA